MTGIGKKKSVHKELAQKFIKELESSSDPKLENVKFQIDFINTELTRRTELVNLLNNNSTRLQHLIDENPRLMRFWFEDLSTAIKIMTDLLNEENLSFRLICVELNALFIQIGDFNK